MPTEVQRRPAEPISVGPLKGTTPHSPVDHIAATKAQQQQQLLQHREALRLALGSILTPKRPPTAPISRSSSGTASPALPPFGLPGSGTHTPNGTPPMTSPYFSGYGPNSSEHLHPHHAYQHHPHAPSRLGRSTSSSSNSNSPPESALSTAPTSAHPSPLPHMGINIDPTTGLPTLPDIEPLPPALTSQQLHENHPATTVPLASENPRPVRPSIQPLHSKSEHGHGDHGMDHGGAMHAQTTQSGRTTPRAKFLQTLEGKSAWDALIHGSFT